MGPGQRIRESWKGRYLTQGDGEKLYPCVEQREITTDHTSFSRMQSTRDVNRSGPRGSDQVQQNNCRIFKESDRVHTWPVVATTQQREEWNHYPRGGVVIDTEDSDSDNKDSVTSPLIHPEDSNDEESPSDPHYANPTPDARPLSEKST